MGKLNKSVVALTFKFDCDRFLRYRLATKSEQEGRNPVPNANRERSSRPGIQLVTYQGRVWEAQCFDDICEVAKGRVAASKSTDDDEDLQRPTYQPIHDLDKLLRKPAPPEFIVEAEFPVPGSLSPALKVAVDSGRLEEASARPDLLWVRPFDGQVALIKADKKPKSVLHVIDVKLAAEPALRHFVEVTFYAFGLQSWLEQHGLDDLYGVCAEGRVWPGTHTASAFKELVREHRAGGSADPVAQALLETTKSVPYEVYRPRLRQFLEERLPRVLAYKPLEAPWHVSGNCQLCDFLHHCRHEAARADVDHLSQMPGLTAGQAQVLRDAGIATFGELSSQMRTNGPKWQVARGQSQRLKSLERAFVAHAEALATNQPVPVVGRKAVGMPSSATMSIFLTAHFDPGTGITFSLGLRKVYFRTKDPKPEVEELTLLVDSAGDGMSAKSEKLRLIELCRRLQSWLIQLNDTNKLFDDDYQKHTVQFYVWDQLEARHMARILARHIEDETVAEMAAFLIRVFPLEGDLAAPEDFRTQPVTIVKGIVQNLVGLPVRFGYTLWDAKNWLAPFINAEGKHVTVRPPYGFHTDLSDQIPFERAYELWQDKILLRKNSVVDGFNKGEPFTRNELSDLLRKVTGMHLSAIHDVVVNLQKAYRSQLLLRKEPFSLKAPKEFNLPTASAQMIVFSQLNAIADDLENMHVLALPIEEREANFHSVRGIVLAVSVPGTEEALASVAADARYAPELRKGDKKAMAFTFSDDSRDTRIREGSFTVILRNESMEGSIDAKWYRAAGHKTLSDAMAAGIAVPDKLEYVPLRQLLDVTVARLDTLHSPPLLVLLLDRSKEKLLQDAGLRDLDQPMVLDPIAKDFSTKLLEQAVRRVGGKKPTKVHR
jgi:hypothetical protein